MTFLDEAEFWPRDITGDHTFLLKAIQEIGRSLGRADTRLPSMVYKYDLYLPDFELASEDDKVAASDIINHNLVENYVEFSEESFFSDSSETSVTIRSAHINKTQWDKAIDLIQSSRDIPIENVDSALAIASGIFQGVASAKVSAVERIHNRPGFMPLSAETFNISDDAAIKARLALGQLDRDKPFDLSPQGYSYIFLGTKSLKTWINTVGHKNIRIGIAKRKILRLAQSYHNHLPSEMKKETILNKEIVGFDFNESEKELLWESLPDKPFKLPGLRQGASRKSTS